VELARELLLRAGENEERPMPVVFHLSSWSIEGLPLAVWLVEELSSKYQVPQRVGQAWVENEQILPLLDGLDEVRRSSISNGCNWIGCQAGVSNRSVMESFSACRWD